METSDHDEDQQNNNNIVELLQDDPSSSDENDPEYIQMQEKGSTDQPNLVWAHFAWLIFKANY